MPLPAAQCQITKKWSGEFADCTNSPLLFDGSCCELLDSDKDYSGNTGEIVDITKEGIVVKTGDKAIVLTKIKPFGKKMMDAVSYVNGVGKDKLLGKEFK